MRPRELTVQGFRSYRDRTTFDLRGRRLVGVVGPIGAGKSTILDAVVFALYGKTPSFERDTRSLIHQLEDGCHVELLFEVDGEIWAPVDNYLVHLDPDQEWAPDRVLSLPDGTAVLSNVVAGDYLWYYSPLPSPHDARVALAELVAPS